MNLSGRLARSPYNRVLVYTFPMEMLPLVIVCKPVIMDFKKVYIGLNLVTKSGSNWYNICDFML